MFGAKLRFMGFFLFGPPPNQAGAGFIPDPCFSPVGESIQRESRKATTDMTMNDVKVIDVKVKNQQAESTNRLKSIFEQSLEVLCEDKDKEKDGSTRARSAHKRCAFLPLHIDAANVQKRALEEAAKALTTLWKISGTRRAKLETRTV